MRHKNVDAVNDNIGQGESVSINELNSGAGIDVVSDRVTPKDMSLEAFMNEILTIIVFEDNAEGALPTVEPTVKGQKQVIVRGAQSRVRRKFVEVLARSRTTKYNQYQRDQTDKSTLHLKPIARMTAPFTVVHDPNPRGPAWLKAILAEA